MRPTIKKVLEESKVLEQDGTATLTCTADGQPLPKLTWWSDGKEINAAKPRFSIATSDTASGVLSILTIQGLRMSDSAIYACKAENKAGVAITTSNVAVSGMYSTVIAKSHQLVSVAKLDKSRRSCPAGVAPGIFRRGADSSDEGLTLPTRGLKNGCQGTINAKNLHKIAFHLPTGVSML